MPTGPWSPTSGAIPPSAPCPSSSVAPTRRGSTRAALRADGGAVLPQPFDLGALLDTLDTLTGGPR